MSKSKSVAITITLPMEEGEHAFLASLGIVVSDDAFSLIRESVLGDDEERREMIDGARSN